MGIDYSVKTILVVDDEPAIADLISDTLMLEGYRVMTAVGGAEALRLAAKNEPDLIISDINMPGMSGLELQNHINKEFPGTLFMFLTGRGDPENLDAAFTKGANEYLTKPVSIDVLLLKVKEILFNELDKSDPKHFKKILWERENEIRAVQLEIITHMAAIAEYKDNDTGEHIKRMAYYATLTAEKYGMSKKDCYLMLHASPMHDIGKVGIPDAILLKPGPLNNEEWRTMKTHTRIGSLILVKSKLKLLKIAATISVSHHEKWDGTGYPQGLKGDRIPLWGRIVAVADVFDALTSIRPYKDAWSVEKALSLIENERGSHFDPDVTDAFFNALPEILKIKKKYSDKHHI